MTGLVLVDKPAGPSSFGVIRGLRRPLDGKVGHAGTLDPFATGLLLVLAGRATRLATFLSGLDKRYRAVVQFGAVSSTLDPEGDLEETGGATSADAVRQAATGLTGTRLQRVPLASAVRVGGERSYARMRRGEATPAAPRPVTIERIDLLGFDEGAQRATIDVACSKGTYVRQIAADLGEATGVGAYCLELRRTEIGPFRVEDAGLPDQVLAEPNGPWFRDARQALPHLPERVLDDAEAAGVLQGRPVAGGGVSGDAVRLVHDGRLIAIGRPSAEGIHPAVVLG